MILPSVCIKVPVFFCYRDTRDGGEEIVGGILAMPKTRSYVDELFQSAEEEHNTKYGTYLKMLATLHQQADICRRYNVDELFFTLMGNVIPSLRAQNVGKRLLDESVTLATERRFKVYTVDCTSNYSDRVCSEHMRMHKLVSLKYKDFVDERGRPYFVIPEPHQGVNTYAATLPWPIKAFREYKC
ncbi:uncharacterized protein LOC133331610 [Musca vetustissima]|uniref:uncharacterized protein LOC133331610 n=1 Tax=Musca vetustissima TaxID=27455 RepID=UPI002AB77909|nr:uncharacterized protein LOC133331610 [Musca vetustissima]